METLTVSHAKYILPLPKATENASTDSPELTGALIRVTSLLSL